MKYLDLVIAACMKAMAATPRPPSIRRRQAWSIGTLFVIMTAVLSACGGSDDGNSSTTTTTTTTTSTPLAVVKPTATCASLASLDLTDIGGVGSTIASATEGAVTINGSDVNFCTVQGTLAPAVGFMVRLPVDSWAQRIVHTGCGGLCGSISTSVQPSFSYGCPLVQTGGMVISSTNMGHSGSEANWSQDAQRRVDFAYRGVHVTTLAAKKLTQAYYGQQEKFSYFVGCSDGGREGLMAAQRFPTDYNGIIAGAPAFLFNIQNSLLHGWNARSNRDNGLSTGNVVLYPSKAAVLHKAVVAACDALDGQTDGLLSDPRLCHFDPATIQCAAGATDTSNCLTATEVASIDKFYKGPSDPTTGRRILVGGPQYGSELSWAGVFVPQDDTVTTHLGADNFVGGARYVIFTEATPPTLDEFQFTEAYYSELRPRHPLNDATNPDLSAFKAAGGKLLLWHGWEDQHISVQGTIAYYEAMQSVMGQTSMDAFMRMYLVPGVAHCGGGEGNENMDMVSALLDWTENGTVPNAVTTTRLDATSGAVVATRPVYPYPAVAKYDGTGDANAAASYTAGPALYTAPTADWAGSDFFTPYAAAPL